MSHVILLPPAVHVLLYTARSPSMRTKSFDAASSRSKSEAVTTISLFSLKRRAVILHDSESLGKNLLELLFDLFVDRLGQRVDLLRNAFLVFERSIEVLQLRFQIGDLLLVLADMVGDGRFERCAART